MVDGCGSGGVAVVWLVACYKMDIWLWVWQFVDVMWLWLWVWVSSHCYGCSVVVGVSSFCASF